MRRLAALLFVCLFASCYSHSQTTSASITGFIFDQTKALIGGATVVATNTATNARFGTKTDRNGSYVLPVLPAGSYRMEIGKPGFKTILKEDLDLHVQSALEVNFQMAIGSTSESVTITGTTADIQTSGTVSTVIDRQLIENMPLNGKDLQTLYELTPGTLLNTGGNSSAGGGFSVNGQRPTSNYVTIDGGSANAYTPVSSAVNVTGATTALSASGGTNGVLPIDAIEEYRMDTSTYTAENGRTPGGQIQVRTRSGTNQFHGTLFENFRNQVLDATDWFVKYNNLKQSQLRMNDFGGTAGGPLWKNKLFFFVAHDTLLLNQPNTTSRQDVPNQATIQSAYPAFKAFLAVFPSGNGGPDPSNPGFDFFSASYPYIVRDHVTSIRLDAALPRSIHVFFRANIAPSTVASTAIQSEAGKVNLSTYTGGMILPINPHLVEEFTLSRTTNESSNQFYPGQVGDNNPNALQANLPSNVDITTGKFVFTLLTPNLSTSVGPGNLQNLSLWNLLDSVAWQTGKHQIKMGGDLLLRESSVALSKTVNQLYTAFESKAPYTSLQNGTLSPYRYTSNAATPVIDIKNLSLYVNDNWRLTSSLTANIGLRWEYNPAATVGPLGVLGLQGTSLDPATIQASVTNQPLYQNSYDNFAPRVGFAWTVRGSQRSGTVLRGGVGTYFDTGQAATAAGAGTALYPYQNTLTLSNVSYQSLDFAGGKLTPIALPQTTVYLVDPQLVSPRTYEWSMTLEQMFGEHSKLALSYVGNDGEKLIGNASYFNKISSTGKYPVNTALVSPNGFLYLLSNRSHSNYQALQAQVTSRLSKVLNMLTSYTWSHAEDNGATDFTTVGGAITSLPLSNSTYDVRHALGAAVHYAPELNSNNRVFRSVIRDWGFDSILRLQSALPLTVTTSNNNPNLFASNADSVPGVSPMLHQKFDSTGKMVPGGVLLNYNAFTAPPKDSSGNPLRQGTSITNGYRLFGLRQWDLSVNRLWKIMDLAAIEFRVDAFNILNVANFAAPSLSWSATNASTFGTATSTYASAYGQTPSSLGQSGTQLSTFQNGGPRELQLSMKLKF